MDPRILKTLAEIKKSLDEIARNQGRLADEQHNRNRLAALTAENRGLYLPDDLQDLADEGR